MSPRVTEKKKYGLFWSAGIPLQKRGIRFRLRDVQVCNYVWSKLCLIRRFVKRDFHAFCSLRSHVSTFWKVWMWFVAMLFFSLLEKCPFYVTYLTLAKPMKPSSNVWQGNIYTSTYKIKSYIVTDRIFSIILPLFTALWPYTQVLTWFNILTA